MARRPCQFRAARRPTGWPLQLLAAVLTLQLTACGGVLNPPPPPTVPPPTVPRPTATPEPTATPTPERWVKNHRVTDMWSGPAADHNAISFGKTSSAFCIFRIDEEIDDARVFVYNPHLDGRFWIDASAIGPVEPPAHRNGPKPEGVNCSDALYDGAAASTTPRAATTGTALTPTSGAGTSATGATSAATAQSTPSPAPGVTPIAEVKSGQPLVLALYYPWYDASTWSSGQTSDLPTQLYASADPSTIARQVDAAREAGIDALASAWFGPKDGNPTETNFIQLLDEAGRGGMHAAILLETDNDTFFPNRAALVQALRHLLTVHSLNPAYLRVDGRPVILVWNPKSVYGSDGRRVNAKSAAAVTAWEQLIDEVDPLHKALWIAEGDYFDFLRVFDGAFPYSIAWSPDPASQLASYGRTVRERASALRQPRIWAATAMPGYDDTRITGRAETFAVPRQDGAYYQRTFQGAIDSRPDWIVITSFNEWLEGTQIEPSRRYGRLYLDLTRTLGGRFRTSRR